MKLKTPNSLAVLMVLAAVVILAVTLRSRSDTVVEFDALGLIWEVESAEWRDVFGKHAAIATIYSTGEGRSANQTGLADSSDLCNGFLSLLDRIDAPVGVADEVYRVVLEFKVVHRISKTSGKVLFAVENGVCQDTANGQPMAVRYPAPLDRWQIEKTTTFHSQGGVSLSVVFDPVEGAGADAADFPFNKACIALAKDPPEHYSTMITKTNVGEVNIRVPLGPNSENRSVEHFLEKAFKLRDGVCVVGEET